MKKLVTLLITFIMVFSLVACGDAKPATEETEITSEISTQDEVIDEILSSKEETEESEAVSSEEVTSEDASVSEAEGYADTKTGKFYSKYNSGKVYLEYEMDMPEVGKSTIISATDGTRYYTETTIPGLGSSTSVIDGDVIYSIDHQNKMIFKMALEADLQTTANTMLEESDVDMADYKTGTYTIDGQTYDTEEWVVDGASSIMCFDGDELVYMIATDGEEEIIMKIIEFSDNVDDSLFELPADYTITEL